MTLRYLPEHAENALLVAAQQAAEMLFRTVAVLEAEATSLGLPT